MPPTTPPPYYNNDQESFAWKSARERWPVIITQAIDDLHKAVSQVDSDKEAEKFKEGKQLVSNLIALKYEIEHDRKLEPFSDAKGDLHNYNDELAKIPLDHNTWLTAPWLYSECYLYRKIATFIAATQHWQNYDVFYKQKMSTFKSSEDGVKELAMRYHQLANQLSSKSTDDEALEVLFREFIDISLWGNATDLSLLTSISLEDIKALQGAESRKKNEKNILANELDSAWDVVSNEREGSRIDIVLDNSGFELFTDVVLALFLLDSKLAETVVIHPKNIPWFVSDVVPADVLHLINQMADSEFFPNADREHMDYLVNKISDYHTEGKIIVRTSPFWTSCQGFAEIKPDGPAGGDGVWQDLKDSNLVIFKGDLNYRKLMWDLAWPRDTPFLNAIDDLADTGIRVLTLRTAKADTVSGITAEQEKQLEDESVAQGKEKNSWSWSGKYALVQYSEGSTL